MLVQLVFLSAPCSVTDPYLDQSLRCFLRVTEILLVGPLYPYTPTLHSLKL